MESQYKFFNDFFDKNWDSKDINKVADLFCSEYLRKALDNEWDKFPSRNDIKINNKRIFYKCKKLLKENYGLISNRCRKELKNKSSKPVLYETSFNEATGELISNNHQIKTLDELLSNSNVDLNIWEVEKYHVNKWDVARKGIKTSKVWENGKIIKGNEEDSAQMVVQTLYQVKAWLKKKSPIDFNSVIDHFKEEVKSYQNVRENFLPHFLKKNSLEKSGNLYMIGLVDHHHGKLAWGKETGYKNYNSKESQSIYEDATNYLLNIVDPSKVDKVLFIVGHDFFNIDNINNTTTSGTPQSQDTRLSKMFMTGASMVVSAIDKISSLYPVDVLVIAGNHDSQTSFFLGEYIKAMYRNVQHVNVFNSPQKRVYYKWGNTLLGMTHGNTEKINELPLLMATESNDWSSCKHRHWFLGHFHHQVIREYNGCKVEILPSLCGTDFWHSSKGYCGNERTSKSFLINDKLGEIANFYYKNEDL